MTLRKRIGGFLTAVLLSTLFVGIANESPASAATCWGSSCNRQSPRATGCEVGAYTLESFWRGNTFIELRYSPTCYSAWARGVSYNTWYRCNGWTNSDWLWIEGSSGGAIRIRNQACLSSAPNAPWHTNMVDFHLWTRACLAFTGPMEYPPRYNGCTRWR